MILMGIDPSFTRTGLSIYNTETKELFITKIVNELPKNKSFQNLFNVASSISENILKIIEDYDVDFIISEVPPPQGSFSSGLFGLDMVILYSIRSLVKEIYTVPPTYLAHIHGKRGYKKSDSSELGKRLIPLLTDKVHKRYTHDEYESLIFLCRLVYIKGFIQDELLSIKPNYKNSKEIML